MWLRDPGTLKFVLSFYYNHMESKKVIRINGCRDDLLKVWNNWKSKNKLIYNNIVKECKICQSKKRLGIHHIDGDKSNNNRENLVCLCLECHIKIHYRIKVLYTEIKKNKKHKEEDKASQQQNGICPDYPCGKCSFCLYLGY